MFSNFRNWNWEFCPALWNFPRFLKMLALPLKLHLASLLTSIKVAIPESWHPVNDPQVWVDLFHVTLACLDGKFFQFHKMSSLAGKLYHRACLNTLLIFKRRQVASIRPNVCWSVGRSVGRSVCLSVCGNFFKMKNNRKIKRIIFDFLICLIFLIFFILLRRHSSWCSRGNLANNQ